MARIPFVPSAREERGSILLIVCVLLVLLMAMSAALLKSAATNNRDVIRAQRWDRAFDVAEAGIDYTINAMNTWKGGSFSSVNVSFGPGDSTAVAISPTFAGVAGTYSLTSTGTVGRTGSDPGTTHRITVVVAAAARGIWRFGLFSNQPLNLSSNEVTDSWISGPPPSGSSPYDSKGNPTVYDKQAVNQYTAPSGRIVTFAGAMGADGSNGNIVFSNSNNYVFGDATPGPGDSVTLDGAFVSGSTAPALNPFTFPAISVLTVAGPAQTLTISKSGSATILSGTYHYSGITTLTGSSLTIRGPATIVVDSLAMDVNTGLTLDVSAGPISFYGTGKFTMASNSPTLGPSSGVPSDLQIFVTTDNFTGYTDPKAYPEGNPSLPVGFGSNGQMVGAIYAPNAVVNLPSNYQIYGSCVAQELGPASNFRVHLDKKLGWLGQGPPQYKMIAMYENPADQ